MKIINIFIISVVCLTCLLTGCGQKSKLTADTGFKSLGSTVNVDLDGDNVMESVYYSLDDFKINGISYKNYIEKLYGNNPSTENFIIADIKRNDKQCEIGLMIEGPSCDPEVFFYKYDNNDEEIIELGSIPSSIKDYADTFDGNGNINGIIRLSIFQTWWAPAVWELKKNKITLKEQDLYYPLEYVNENGFTLKVKLPIYRKIGDKSSFTSLNPQKVTFPATDNKKWCQIVGADKVQGWFRIDGFDTISDLGQHAFEVFDGLSNAG